LIKESGNSNPISTSETKNSPELSPEP